MMLPSFIFGFGLRLSTGRKLGQLLDQMKHNTRRNRTGISR